MSSSRLLPLGLLILLSAGCDSLPPDDGRCKQDLEGACWTHLGLEGKNVTTIADTPWGIFAGTRSDGIFRRGPGETAWTPLGLEHAVISSIAFVPGAEPRLLVGMNAYADEQTHAAVWASEDRGATWYPSDGGLAERRGGRGSAFGLAVDPGNANRVFMTYFDQITRSDDGGRTWNFLGGGAEHRIGGGIYRDIVISPSRDGTVWIGGESSLLDARLWRSRDWGDTWEVMRLDPWSTTEGVEGDGAILSLTVNPQDPSRLVAGMNFGWVMYSQDGGTTWSPVRLRPQGADVWGLHYDGGVLYAATRENFRPNEDGTGGLADLGFYRSRDNGVSWSPLRTPETASGAWALAPDVQGDVLVGTMDGLWRAELD